jgi:hypothetical protein
MVRAGVVAPPRQGPEAGYQEIQQPPRRERIIDRAARCSLLGTTDNKLAQLQNEWIAAVLAHGRTDWEPPWSEVVAVGRRSFVERGETELGLRALHRGVEEVDGAAVLRDAAPRDGPRSSGEIAPVSLHSPGDSTDC